MPHQTEPNANNVLGNLLRGMMPGCEVRSENTQTFSDYPGRHADVLITAPGRSPVAVEGEYEPAPEAEKDARERLGLRIVGEPRTIEAAIALRYPQTVEEAYDLHQAVSEARLSYCVFTVDKRRPTPNREIQRVDRFPESGWLEGSASDLADLIRLVSVPRLDVENAANALQGGIDRAAAVLEQMGKSRPSINGKVARLLGMDNVPQTRRMAGAIIANAMVFHERIAGMHPGIEPLSQVCGADVDNPKAKTLAAWAKILEINYWPIFEIARRILDSLPAGEARGILHTLEYTVGEFSVVGVKTPHDLTGRVFQRLIADRKYLATFYTLPESAALLARLAVAKLRSPSPLAREGEINWGDADALGKLRIGDFACGTGALLSAVYEQIAARHERAGGDPAGLHPVMMEEVLYGCDVMPSAVHITGATLSGAQPNVAFGKSRLYTLPYGRLSDGNVAIGSLEFLASNAQLTMSNFSDPALRTAGSGEEMAAQAIAEIPDASFDIVIMNPPFTSNTKHRDAKNGVLNAAFAAFDASDADQSSMANRLEQMAKDTCYHGHAGLVSGFAALADRKVRPNGIIAMVLPFPAINGPSWAKFRELIATQYTDIAVVSIAGVDTELSFSSDTDIGECLVIGRKITQNEQPSRRGNFVSLQRKPASFAHALELSKSILAHTEMRHLEDGPYGGIPIYYGDAPAGELLDAPVGSYENGWGAARILDASVAQVAHSLSAGDLWLPAEPKAHELPVVPLNHVGQRGLDSQLFISAAHKGPFIKATVSPTATYPSLWNHDAKKETRMICVPDSQMRVRLGMEAKAAELWATASRAHLNRDFRFNSQPLTASITEHKSIGGVAWPSVTFPDARFDYAFVLWCNSTFGLLLFWWHANRQQSGRGRKTIRSSETLPVLDFRALSDEQLATAQAIFEEFRDRELQPAYIADADPNRALLDRRVVCDLLGFDEEVYRGVRRLAAKWCAEPSVHGGKKRPRSAALVV